MDSDFLKEHIFKLEKSLLKPEVRLSACSSGKIYNYKKGDVIDSKDNSSVQIWKIKDFSIDILAGDIILAKYKAIKHNKLEDKKICSIRSSIWKYVKGSWKMVFHQGTLTEKKFT